MSNQSNLYTLLRAASVSITCIALFTFSVIESQLSPVVSYLILLFIGIRIFRSLDARSTRLFTLCFNLYVLTAVALVSLHQLEHGDPFTLLGDDKGFYETARQFKDGDTNFEHIASDWDGINYKGYIFILAGWLRFLNVIGFSSDFYFNLNILNTFFGACVPALVYLIFRKWADHRLAYRIAAVVAFYPPIIYFSTSIIRDTLVTLLFAITVFVALAGVRLITKILILSMSLVLLYAVREVSSVFALVFLLIQGITTYRRIDPRLILYSFFAGAAIFFTIYYILLLRQPTNELPPITHLLDYVTHRIHFYFDLTSYQADIHSLGAKIRHSKNVLLLALSIPLTYFSPVPPLFIHERTIGSILMGLGNLMWYWFGFVYLVGLILTQFRTIHRLHPAILGSLIVALLLVTFTSGDFRHLYFIHPYLIGFAVTFLSNNKKQVPLLSASFVTFTALLMIVYVLLKTFLN